LKKINFNVVKFSPVKTAGLKLELKSQKDFSAGLQEWKVN